MISLIVAMAEDRVIGGNNQLLWHMPADLKHFKELTLGKPIIMGRKTFESIGRPLPGRTNIVITRDPSLALAGCEMADSLESALQIAGKAEEIMVIGGGQIFLAALPLAQRVYLTVVHHHFAGDTYFPKLSDAQWQLTAKEDFSADEKNPYAYSFMTYERVVG